MDVMKCCNGLWNDVSVFLLETNTNNAGLRKRYNLKKPSFGALVARMIVIVETYFGNLVKETRLLLFLFDFEVFKASNRSLSYATTI